MAILGISLAGNKEQQELARLIQQNDKHIIFCEGAAGTGKTFVAVATALQMIKDKKYKRIIYTRDPINMGTDIGFLKGDADAKIMPYMAPLEDTIRSIVAHGDKGLNIGDLMSKCEVEPLAFMRGRNISDDTICIFDEAQNNNITELRTMMTRISEYAKIIILGSNRQIDNPKQRKQEKCDFQRAYELLDGLPYVGVVQLTKSMRSPWCVEIDELFDQIEDVSPKNTAPLKNFSNNSSSHTKTYNINIGDGINEDRTITITQ